MDASVNFGAHGTKNELAATVSLHSPRQGFASVKAGGTFE